MHVDHHADGDSRDLPPTASPLRVAMLTPGPSLRTSKRNADTAMPWECVCATVWLVVAYEHPPRYCHHAVAAIPAKVCRCQPIGSRATTAKETAVIAHTCDRHVRVTETQSTIARVTHLATTNATAAIQPLDIQYRRLDTPTQIARDLRTYSDTGIHTNTHTRKRQRAHRR